MSASTLSAQTSSPDPLHAQFLQLLPRLEKHAAILFRHIECPAKKADKIAEVLGLAWKWLRRLHECGKDVSQFPMVFIYTVGRSVKCGRRLCGNEGARDVMNEQAQRRHSFTVERLPASTRQAHEALYGVVQGQRLMDSYEERLRDNTVTAPPVAAAFRIDFPRFLAGLARRDRKLAEFLSLGNSPKHAACRFRISQDRVTQLRQQWCRQWRIGQGETVAGAPG